VRRHRWHFFMTPLEHTSILWLDDLYRGLLTPSGRVAVWIVASSTILLAGGLAPALATAFAFGVTALACALLFGLPFRPRVTATRHLPPSPSAGDSWTYTVRVRNCGRTTLRMLNVEERGLPLEVRPLGEAPVIDRLRPGEEASVRLRLRCLARGAYVLGKLQVASSFPSALCKLGRVIPLCDRLLVYPAFAPIAHMHVPASRLHQPGGIAVASRVGDSSELLGLRDWRDGDRIRDVHWPTYARTSRLMVRETQEEYFVRLAMVLDVGVHKHAQERLFERALSLAAGIADTLARRDYIVDIFAAGESVYHFQAGRALAHLDHILEILACLEPGDRLDGRALEAALLPEAARLSCAIFVFLDWDQARADLVARLRALGVSVRVLVMRHDRDLVGLTAEEALVLP